MHGSRQYSSQHSSQYSRQYSRFRGKRQHACTSVPLLHKCGIFSSEMRNIAPPGISPSILAADTMQLGAAVAAVEAGGATSLHVDVMDGHYVANLAFSPKTIEDLRRITRLPLHAHLEVANTDACLAWFAGADVIVVQEDAAPDLAATLARVRALGCGVGVAVNPERPVAALAAHLGAIDLLLVMAVQPGFGGQPFDREVLAKVRWAREQRARLGLGYAIGLDGGVTVATAAEIVAAGADTLIVGTGVFGAGPEPAAIAARVRELRGMVSAERR